jgi:hypothetical protein
MRATRWIAGQGSLGDEIPGRLCGDGESEGTLAGYLRWWDPDLVMLARSNDLDTLLPRVAREGN